LNHSTAAAGIPGCQRALVRKLGRAADAAKALDWRMHELTVMLAERLPAPALR
jgi:hypothetical protein